DLVELQLRTDFRGELFDLDRATRLDAVLLAAGFDDGLFEAGHIVKSLRGTAGTRSLEMSPWGSSTTYTDARMVSCGFLLFLGQCVLGSSYRTGIWAPFSSSLRCVG